MKRYNGFLNEAFDMMPWDDSKMFSLGSSYEDLSVAELEQEMSKMMFILDQSCPGKHVAVCTGDYVIGKDEGEIYDNYLNRYIVVDAEYFWQNMNAIMAKETALHESIGAKMRPWKIDLIATIRDMDDECNCIACQHGDEEACLSVLQ